MSAGNQLSKLNGNALQEFYPVDMMRMESALEKAKENMALVKDTKEMFKFKNTRFMNDAFVISKRDDLRNMHQVCNQIEDRQTALIVNKFALEDGMLEADELEEKAGKWCNWFSPKKRKRLRAKAKKMRDQASMSFGPVMGCIEELNYLTEIFRTLKAKIVAEHGEFTEAVFEKMEQVYWIKELLHQAMYDIRKENVIGVGAQRSLEQIGLDPIWCQIQLKEIQAQQLAAYRSDIVNKADWNKKVKAAAENDAKPPDPFVPEHQPTTRDFDEAIDILAKTLDGVHDAKMIRLGMIESQEQTEQLVGAAK